MTEKKFAHEIVAHPEEGEAMPLDYLVRYHYSQATGWHLAFGEVLNESGPRFDLALSQYLHHAHLAFLHDALHQGLAGQEAVDWVSVRNHSESAEWTWERAVACGLNPDEIKPYLVRNATKPTEYEETHDA